METIISKITEDMENNKKLIAEAAQIIRRGGLVAFPTETVYGLGGDAFDVHAAEKIYDAKGRPSDNPLIVHISETKDLNKLCDDVPPIAYVLADRFWPGPLTMIVRKNSQVPSTVTGGLDTVAVRLPSHPVARALIAESGTFIAAPSANISGRPSPTTAQHVIEDMSGRIDMIIDDGAIEIGLESTIIDLTDEVPMILRPGYITREMLQEVLGEVENDPALMVGVGDAKPKAPGMKYRHYAPKAELTVIEGEAHAVIQEMKRLVDEAVAEGITPGVMVTGDRANYFEGIKTICLSESGNQNEIAANLFAALREFDETGVDVIFSEGFSEEGLGKAIMNRLLKAAGHKVIMLTSQQ